MYYTLYYHTMRCILHRTYLGPNYTIGGFSIGGGYLCDMLEDHYRDLNIEEKVYGKTAIPYGTYKVILYMSPRSGRLLPMLLDVPHFTWILIHRGNFPENSEGCLLPGENTKKGMVLNSTKYEKLIVKKMKAATKRGEEITIEIV